MKKSGNLNLNLKKIGKKISTLYKKIWINKKYRKVFLGVIAALFLIIAIIIIVSNSSKLSSIEERELRKNSEIVMGYMEEIENVKKTELSSYVIYAMEYNYNENDKTSLTLSKMKKLLEGVFNRTFSEKEIEKLGITPDMLDKNISYDPGEKKFTIDKSSFSYADIAATKIIKYQLQSIKKKGKNKFVATYDKYVVSNPYEVLNYYDNLNNENNSKKDNKKKETNVKTYDTTDIFNYLTGKEKVKVMKTYITDENASKVGKKKGTVVVKYLLEDDNILVNEIKSDNKKIEY